MASSEDTPEAIGNAPTIESTPNDDLGSAASLLRRLASAPGAPPRRILSDGQIVGDKYRVEEAVGEGGMGVVYRARDVKLNRDVALKVGSLASVKGLARMEREAQVLAKLAHPNVVVVYEVGVVDGRVFVAMEFVRDGTVRKWLSQKRRTPREIVELFCAAGDGLAAAHAAGIVHRDFKPDNVLVGDDRRARVADFGLAGSLDELDPGQIAGTPAYMAPEQRAGETLDARADQFAFCVALWEALYGSRPPEQKVDRGPKHVEAALRRGLVPEREARWPGLPELLTELRRDPARRLRRVLLGAGIAAVLAAAVITPLALRTSSPCGDDATALGAVWNQQRAASIAPALRDPLEKYARAWVVAHHDACVATRVAGTQSIELYDRRMLCLAAARSQLDAIASATSADAIGVLRDLDACGDVESLARQAPLPTDRAGLEKAYVELAAARVSAPADHGEHVLATATATGWAPIVADASRRHAELVADTAARRRALQDAANLALAAGDDRGAAWAMVELARQLTDEGDAAAAKSWVELARAIWSRTGRSGQLGIRIRELDAATHSGE